MARLFRPMAMLVLAVWLLAVVLGACSPAQALREVGGPADTLQITVSVAPQEYFARRIGGDRVAVTVMVPPGASPHTYEPRPEQMRALSRADAYLRIGVAFEDAWMERFADVNRGMLIVDTTEGIERMLMAPHSHEKGDDPDADEKHAEDDAHGADQPDPHVWVSPRLVKVQAEATYRALAQLDPDREAEYRANLDAFLGDIDALDAEISEMLTGLASRKFIVFHPAWGYFAADYDLEQIPIEVGGLEPSAAALARVITTAREEGIRVVLAQPEFSTQAAETIAREIGGRVEMISPLDPNWLENMRTVARTLAEILGDCPCPR